MRDLIPSLPSLDVDVRGRLSQLAGGTKQRASSRYVKRRVIGRPDRFKRRALNAVIVLSIGVILAGAFYAFTTDVDKLGSSSLPYLRPALEVVTSTWVLPIMIAYVGRKVIIARRDLEARQAAEVTGYSTQSVKRLGEEVKQPDEAARTRVIATSDDSAEAIRDRIEDALEHGEDNTLDSIRAEYQAPAADDVEEELQDVDVVDDEIAAELEDVRAQIRDLEEEIVGDIQAIDAGPSAEPPAEPPAEPLEEPPADRDTDVLDALEEFVSNVSYFELDADDRARVKDVEQQITDLEELEQREIELLRDQVDDLDDDIDHLKNNTELSEDGAGDDQEPAADDVEDEIEDWSEQYRLFKLDLLTALDVDELLWRVGLPAGLTIAGLMIVVQFWVQPWLYPPIAAVGVLVGVLNYLRVERQRNRRLDTLRGDTDAVTWNDLAIHVKEVSVPETRVQIARMAGETYAHDDREAFADEVAVRAYERVNGIDPSPSIMTKQADQLAAYQPDLHGFRDAERERIAIWLESAVENANGGLIPKAKLLEECIEQPSSSWLPFSRESRGYDPELVSEMYRTMVPAALVEHDVPVEDEDGEAAVTSVRLRNDPVPAEYGAVLASFSNQFKNYARRDPLYELPDVEDQLTEEPIYADTIGALS